MKKIVFIAIGVFLFAGCGEGKEVVIRGTEDAEQKVVSEKVEGGEDAVATGELDAAGALGEPLVITENFITWGHESAQRQKTDIDTVIVHSVYNPFDGDTHSLDEIVAIFKDYGVAPHYIITRDGTVHQLVKEKNIAWHAGRSRVPDGRANVNDFSIGIEMINSLEDTYTDAQYTSLRALLLDIKKRYTITYILGHDEIEVHDPWNFDWEKINDLRHEARETK